MLVTGKPKVTIKEKPKLREISEPIAIFHVSESKLVTFLLYAHCSSKQNNKRSNHRQGVILLDITKHFTP